MPSRYILREKILLLEIKDFVSHFMKILKRIGEKGSLVLVNDELGKKFAKVCQKYYFERPFALAAIPLLCLQRPRSYFRHNRPSHS